MFYYDVSMVGNVGKFYSELTYAYDGDLAVGTIVKVPVGQKDSLGVVVKRRRETPDFECKKIMKVVVDTPLPPHLIKTHDWMCQYYATSSGAVWQTFLPARVGVKPRAAKGDVMKSLAGGVSDNASAVPEIKLNPTQAKAVQEIETAPPGAVLLRGITGSGKTEVYKQVAADTLAAGRSVIILVPEISLTAQLVMNFRARFADVVVTHSAMTAAERNRVWRTVLTAQRPLVVIGPRSALFLPVQNLGLVVIDECHEPSYRQEKAPRYNTLTVAAQMCAECGARLILGSATPSISDYYLAKRRGRPIVTMDQLARPGAARPTTEIVDLTKRDNFTTESRLFTAPLLRVMRQALNEHRQALLFHNRRGTAGTAMCKNCGWTAACPNCFIPLTLHGDKYQLVCHLCGFTTRPPLKCPDCGNAEIVYRGIGTKRIEEEAKKLFPKANIKRFDGDSEKGQGVQDLYDQLRDGQVDIIIGTQTIAKGLDLPHLAVVGVVQADAGLMLPDFGASERTFQLVAQVCGRVGRSGQPTTAIIQSYRPDEPAVRLGAAQDYAGFYDAEIRERQRGHFPPFSYLLKLTCSYKTEAGAVRAANKLADEITEKFGERKIKLLGPAPSFYERLRGLYRWQIVVRAVSHQTLVEIAGFTETAGKGKWAIELDPGSLL